MSETDKLIADVVEGIGTPAVNVTVSLSNELVHLLSEQLYQSPLKAIEELVVNAFDADATECRVFVPPPTDEERKFVVVYDNGTGMDAHGLVNLWYIGRSIKRTEDFEKRRKRKQIGKFGIGKLATYTIADRVTYITRTGDEILTVTLDFRRFAESATGQTNPISLPVIRLDDWNHLRELSRFQRVCASAGIRIDSLFTSEVVSWTISVLEELKPKASKVSPGRLSWVLRTAMPLTEDFKLYLNGEGIGITSEDVDVAVRFSIAELPERRLKAINDASGESWKSDGNALFSKSFPSGVTGKVIVAVRSLLGKSEDLGRSHGFFVRVRDRLVNEVDALFGVQARSFQTFYRFRAEIYADDLDAGLTAPREDIEESSIKEHFRSLLQEIFNEARQRYEVYLDAQEKGDSTKKEAERSFVSPSLVEHPIADALITQHREHRGAEADETWFYVELDESVELSGLIEQLYTTPRSKYRFSYENAGKSKRLVRFTPATSIFSLNWDHPFIQAHGDDGRSRVALHDIVFAEVLLEVYLRESQAPAHAIGEVLERRDALLRGLALDHPFSLSVIATHLREAAGDKYDLEVAIVAAVRALGFVSKHISGADEPDGVARFTSYPTGEKKITLEAKSSAGEPTLPAIDFAGLQSHMATYQADGCLLVAPSYPGSTRGTESQVSQRAMAGRISCWTVNQLSNFVEAAQSRHLTAMHVLDIVLNNFTPDDVSKAISDVLSSPAWATRDLYVAVLQALRDLEDRLPDAPRTIDLIAAEVSRLPDFRGIHKSQIGRAVSELAAASHGAITLRENELVSHVSHEELERRVAGLTSLAGEPRRPSQIHERGD